MATFVGWIQMNIFLIIKLSVIIFFLSACSQTEQEVDFTQQEKAFLSYSTPDNNQQSVDVDSSILLTFTHEISDSDLLESIRIIKINGEVIPITVSVHPANSKMVVVQPVQSLEPGQIYNVDFSNILSVIGLVGGDSYITFSTLNSSVQPSGNGSGSDSNDGADDSGNGSGDDSDGGSGEDSGSGSGEDSDNGSGDDSGDGSGDDSDNESGDDSDNGSGDDSDNGSGDDSDNGSGDDSDNGSGGDSDNGAGGDSDNGSGDNTDNGTDDSIPPLSSISPVDFSDIKDVINVQWPEYKTGVFQVLKHFPAGDLPFVDFSTLHLYFSHNIDPKTVRINETFSFIKEGEAESVPGSILVKGKNISFDPDEDLEGGVIYTLSLTSEIKSEHGSALSPDSYSEKPITPKSSLPRLALVQKIKGQPDGPTSLVNEATHNSVLVDSKLIGKSMSYADADYHVELANFGSFLDTMPFVIRKGSVIRMSSMEVKIGGAIPAGYETDTLFLTLTTDAVGYLTASEILLPYKKRRLTLLMDTSMIAENPTANGALSQDLLNVTLTGIAGFTGSILEVDAVGDISVELLGLETASSTATFFLEAYADQDNAPLKEIDVIAPVLQHWIPGNMENRFKLSDSILLTFNEGLEARNIENEIELLDTNGMTVESNVRQDGSVVIIDPVDSLIAGTHYEILISSNVTDMAGNALDEPIALTFTTEAIDINDLAAPILSSVYPGYNCRLTDPDYVNDIAGRCSGGKETDDKFNIFTLPINRSIQVEFNQPMDLDTIELGQDCGEGNFRVEKIDEDRNCLEGVSGYLTKSAQGLMFEPKSGWEEGTLYRYSIFSEKTSSCIGSAGAPCSIHGLPLNPKPLKIKNDNRQEGGNSFHMPFRVIQAEEILVFNPLSQVPTADVNRNFLLDNSESPITANASRLAIDGTTGLVQEAILGCREGSCESQKSIYLSGSLPSDVGAYDPIKKHIPVYMYPQALMTTTVTMYAKTILGWLENPTGPQVMRMRSNYNEQGKSVPTLGYITWDEDSQQAIITTSMNVYLDAPGLAPKILGLELDTNMHSLPLTIELQGPVNFIEDGRMEISLSNTEIVDIDVVIESFLGDSDVYLKIPKNALSINLVSKMTKH